MAGVSKDKAVQKMNNLGSHRIPFMFIIDFLMNSPIILPLAEIDSSRILYDLRGKSNYKQSERIELELKLNKFPVSFKRYSEAFENVRKNIYEGNSYLLNLTFPTRIEINIDLREIFCISKAKYKLLLENQFVVFSPESFVQIKNNIISAFPMKGTIDATDENAVATILSNEKELAEHNTIVDLIRNDLSLTASNVRLESFRYIERISTSGKDLYQVSSKISGTLRSNYHEQIGTIIFKMLPAGSVSGAPKKKTVEIILESEKYDRGYYTGVFGIYDGNSLDSGVMIRYIENINGELYYKSGGGITSLSSAEMEYQEMIDKVYVPIN